MLLSSLAVIALSASAVVNPFSSLVHMHPHTASADSRVSVVLYNKSASWQDVRIGDSTYTVLAHKSLEVKAPAGTVIYAASKTAQHKRGDAIVEVTPKINNQQISLD